MGKSAKVHKRTVRTSSLPSMRDSPSRLRAHSSITEKDCQRSFAHGAAFKTHTRCRGVRGKEKSEHTQQREGEAAAIVGSWGIGARTRRR